MAKAGAVPKATIPDALPWLRSTVAGRFRSLEESLFDDQLHAAIMDGHGSEPPGENLGVLICLPRIGGQQYIQQFPVLHFL